MAEKEFDGFSSEEEGEVTRPPSPVTPAPNLVLPAESQKPESSVFLLPITLETDPAVPETSSGGLTKAWGGVRGGGRPKTPLPVGCQVFVTESGAENFVCSCEKTYTEKKSLLRHYLSCSTNKDRFTFQPTLQPPCKKRKFDSSTEPEAEFELDQESQDTITTAYFNEDTDGARLLQCELIL